MLSDFAKKNLIKQQYRFVGNHSAVKVCLWTRKFLRNEGGCYKFTFYGIRSHQCLQMTTSMFCANRCTFCWRGQKAPVSKDWYGPIDDPKHIVEHAIDEQIGLLQGMGGNPKVPKKLHRSWEDVRHVALSLTGEPITYPRMNEILDEFHRRKISTFLVTNGQYPEQMEKVKNVTQMYISVDAPNKKLLKKIDRPLFDDYYERLLKCLDIMAKKKYRSTIRLTIIKGQNDSDLEGYKELIERGKPDFIEVKGYVHVGVSIRILKKENMPYHAYVSEFAKKLEKIMLDYEIVDDHKPSRVILFIRKDKKQYRFIDFQKFFELSQKKEVAMEDYGSSRMKPN
ncbi:4-demethylwyosine synthase TYW1 [Candidatus Woesearchaeota archaeon]|nr:4-demethylwyosine synthase TYW1 [Candidatus Woesearchaeota archaeon]